jgi:hypothetical protein
MFELKSNTTYYGPDYFPNGLVTGMKIAFKLGYGLRNVTFVKWDFRDVKYPFLAGFGEQGNDTMYGLNLAQVDLDNAQSDYAGTLCFGRGKLHDVNMYDCSHKHARLVLTGSGAMRWRLIGNVGMDSHNSDIYLRGHDHHVEKNRVIRSGKDCIKVRQNDNGSGSGTVIIDNDCETHGVTERDMGAIINLRTPKSIVGLNKLRVTRPAEPFEGRKYRCIRVSDEAEGCIVGLNDLYYPSGEIFEGMYDTSLNTHHLENTETIEG